MLNLAKFWDEVFMDYSKNHKTELAQSFDEYYGKFLLAEFGRLKLSQITPRMIERFLQKLSKTKTQFGRPFSLVTVRMIYSRLNQLFNMAIGERVIPENGNPCRLVNSKVLEEFPTWTRRERWLGKYSPDEEEKLFKELDGPLQTICRLLLNTGLRPPKGILRVEKAHLNLSDKPLHYRFRPRDGEHLRGQHTIIPPRAVLVVHGKDGRVRTVPLNRTAQRIFLVLCNDSATGEWLFRGRGGKPLASIKKGFAAACERAGIEDLRSYDLRHSFATRLVDRNVHEYVISALLGHVIPVSGFGHASRIIPGYAHATWEAMQRAVESLEYPPAGLSIFQSESGKSQAKIDGEGAATSGLKVG